MRYYVPLAVLLLFHSGTFGQDHQPDSLVEKKLPVSPWFVERFKLSTGFFIPQHYTKASLGDANGNTGTTVDFEKDLGFNTKTTTLIVDLKWRSSRRSRFDLSFYRLNRSSVYIIDKQIKFGDNTYDINASIKSFFNTNIYRLSYGYAIVAKPTYEIGLIAGLHIVRAHAGIGLYGSASSVIVDGAVQVTEPLPDLGIWGDFTIAKNLSFTGEINYMDITYKSTKGLIMGYNFSIAWRILRNLALATGFSGLNCHVDLNKKIFSSHIDWGYNGPSLTAAYTFGKKSWSH